MNLAYKRVTKQHIDFLYTHCIFFFFFLSHAPHSNNNAPQVTQLTLEVHIFPMHTSQLTDSPHFLVQIYLFV